MEVKDYRNDLESSGGVTTPVRKVSEVLRVPLTATELARRLDDHDRVAGLVVADPVGTDTTRFTMMLGSKLVGGEDLEDIAYEPVEVRDGRIVWWVSGKLVRSLH